MGNAVYRKEIIDSENYILSHFNGEDGDTTIIDEVWGNWENALEDPPQCDLTTSKKKLGTASCRIPAYISSSQPRMFCGLPISGDYTLSKLACIEFFFYHESSDSTISVFGEFSGGESWRITTNIFSSGGDTIFFMIRGRLSDEDTYRGGLASLTIVPGVWHHCALVVDPDNISLYYDGELIESILLSLDTIYPIGRVNISSGSRPPGGTSYIDEFRIKLNEIVYSGSSIIIPTEEFTNATEYKNVRVRNMHHKTSVSSEVRAKGVYYKTGTGINTFSSSIKTYGVRIDNTNSNPETGVEYTDDAVGMTGGSTTWDTLFPFLDIKPCLLKEGVVQYYLNPNNYSQKADGSASDITSGTDGDVMIEIPKMAYSMKTVGNYLYVKVTNNPSPTNNVDGTEDWCFHAHTRSTEADCQKLYIGAYLGWTDGSSKLRSLSGKAPTTTQTIGTFRTRAQANGTGYDQIAFYPLTLLQCLFLIRYKNRDSQTALGRGFVDGNSAATNTGGANIRGMYYGEVYGKKQLKFAGIEDFWGNLYYWIDGLFSNATRNILTAFKAFNDTGSGYADRGQGATWDIPGYMSVCQGTSATGFITKMDAGSELTYFCDNGVLGASRLPYFGGYFGNSYYAGAFRIDLSGSAADAYSSIGGRLMYMGVSAPEPVKIRVNL